MLPTARFTARATDSGKNPKPKNVEAIFYAAERDDAVLFIDEAHSLLSKRLTNVTQGSEQAINFMRSQLLICLETFHGIVIFATNFIESYDKAFRSRIRDIFFPHLDYESRLKIWKRHLPSELPLEPDVVLEFCRQSEMPSSPPEYMSRVYHLTRDTVLRHFALVEISESLSDVVVHRDVSSSVLRVSRRDPEG